MFKSKLLSGFKSCAAQDTELQIAAYIEAIKGSKAKRHLLLEFLREDFPAYQERSSNVVQHLRGYALAAMYPAGLPAGAFPYIAAILQTERSAYLVAAAARALRAAAPIKEAVPLLLKSIDNIRLRDDAISFSTYQPAWPIENYTTALHELMQTIQFYGEAAAALKDDLQFLVKHRAYDFNREVLLELTYTIEVISATNQADHCCEEPNELVINSPGLFFRRSKDLSKIIVQDQEEQLRSLEDLLTNKLTVLTFFYTRCDNPLKCSMTISRLGHLKAALAGSHMEKDINIFGISYDASYDSPNELKIYGNNRGIIFSSSIGLLRVTEGYGLLKNMLRLGVSYIGALVNVHKNELYIVDQKGNVLKSFLHQRWEVDELKDALATCHQQQHARRNSVQRVLYQPIQKLSRTFYSVVFPLLFAFFPKCPLCWAAYLSSFGLSGLSFIPYTPWLYPLILTVVAINLYVLFKRAYKRKYYLPCVFSSIGFLLVMLLGGLLKIQPAVYAGILFILSGSLLNSFPIHIGLRRSNTDLI